MVWAEPQGAVWGEPQGAVWGEPQGAVWGEPQGAVWAEPRPLRPLASTERHCGPGACPGTMGLGLLCAPTKSCQAARLAPKGCGTAATGAPTLPRDPVDSRTVWTTHVMRMPRQRGGEYALAVITPDLWTSSRLREKVDSYWHVCCN